MEHFIEGLEDQCILVPIRNEHSWFSLLLIKCPSVIRTSTFNWMPNNTGTSFLLEIIFAQPLPQMMML